MTGPPGQGKNYGGGGMAPLTPSAATPLSTWHESCIFWTVLLSASDELNLELINSANTTRALIYNRVSKCASTTMLELIRRLSRRNGFHHAHSTVYNKRHLNSTEQKQLAAKVMKLKNPYLFDRHVHMLNFTAFGYPQPTYINIVRDPVERFVSAYYYQWSTGRRKSAKRNQSIKGLVSLIATVRTYVPRLNPAIRDKVRCNSWMCCESILIDD